MKTATWLPERSQQMELEGARLKSKMKKASASARLAVVLFTTGIALLVVGFLAN